MKNNLNEIRELLTVVHTNTSVNKYYFVKRMSGSTTESFFTVVISSGGETWERIVDESEMPKISTK